jgi:hypothetical protein
MNNQYVNMTPQQRMAMALQQQQPEQMQMQQAQMPQAQNPMQDVPAMMQMYMRNKQLQSGMPQAPQAPQAPQGYNPPTGMLPGD